MFIWSRPLGNHHWLLRKEPRVNIKQALAIYKPGADQENNLKHGRGLKRQRGLKGKLWDNFMFTHIINVHTHRVKLYTCNCLSLLSIFIFILLLLCFIKDFPIFLNSSGQKQNILVFKVESTAKIFMNTLGTCITIERKFKVARGGRGWLKQQNWLASIFNALA